jgi:hypothetical protein
VKRNNKNDMEEESRLRETYKFNQIRSKIIDASTIELYEVSNELYLLEPHQNDLYNQN